MKSPSIIILSIEKPENYVYECEIHIICVCVLNIEFVHHTAANVLKRGIQVDKKKTVSEMLLTNESLRTVRAVQNIE